MANNASVLLIQIFGVLVAVSLLIISIITYSKTDFNTSFIEDLQKNIQLSPMDNIFLCNGKGYVFNPAKFPGTVTGCDCSDALFYIADDLSRGKCSSTSRKRGCSNINPTEEQSLPDWKGLKLCYSTLGIDYLTLWNDAASPGTQCKEGLKACGILDSVGNILCLKECPINNIQVKTKNESSPGDLYQVIESNSTDYVLYFTNQLTNNSACVQLKDSEGDICLNPQEYNFKGAKYILDSDYNEKVFRCTAYSKNGVYSLDSRFSFLDEINKRTLYENNNVLYQSLPYYPSKELKNMTVKLYTRNYIGMKKQCKSDYGITPSLFMDLFPHNDKVTGKNLAIMIITILLLVCSGFFIFISRTEDYIIHTYVTGAIYVVLALVCFILAITNRIEKGYEYDLLSQCVDNLSLIFFEALEYNANRVNNLITSMVVLFGINFVSSLTAVYLFYKANREDSDALRPNLVNDVRNNY